MAMVQKLNVSKFQLYVFYSAMKQQASRIVWQSQVMYEVGLQSSLAEKLIWRHICSWPIRSKHCNLNDGKLPYDEK